MCSQYFVSTEILYFDAPEYASTQKESSPFSAGVDPVVGYLQLRRVPSIANTKLAAVPVYASKNS